MAGTTAAVELKVLISVVQDSQAQILSVLGNLKTMIDLFKNLDQTSLSNAAQQLQSLAAHATKVTDNIKPLTTEGAGKLDFTGVKGVEIGSKFTPPSPDPILEVEKGLEDKPVEIPSLIKPPPPEVSREDYLFANLGRLSAENDKRVEEAQKRSFATLGQRVRENEAASAKAQSEIAANKFAVAQGEAEKLFKSILGGSRESAGGIDALNAKVNQLGGFIRFAAGGFLALESVRFLKDLADTAARAQVLATVLHVVGQNAGFTIAELDKADKAVQRMGITAQSSRQSLTQLIQANLDIKWAAPLARAAQDLAVISGVNSSDTFQRLILNIQQLDTLGLRWMGIVVNRQEGERRFQREVLHTTRELTQQEKVQALLNETLKKAKDLEGNYEAAMGDVGKQLASLDRFTIALKTSLGDALLPTYLALVEEFTLMIRQLTTLADLTTQNKDASQAAGDAVREWAAWIRHIIISIAEHTGTIITLVKWYLEYKAAALILRGLIFIGSGAIAFIEFLFKIKAGIEAVRAGTLTLSVAMRAMGFTLPPLTAQMLGLATAEVAVGRGAATAVLGMNSIQGAARLAGAEIATVGIAWSTLAGILAVPIVVAGVIWGKQQKAAREEEEDKKPFWEQAKEALREPGFLEGVAGSIGLGPNLSQEDRNVRLRNKFEQWQKDNKDLVDQIKNSPDFKEISDISNLTPRQNTFLQAGIRPSPLTEAFGKQVDLRDQTKLLEEASQRVKEYEDRLATLGPNAGRVQKEVIQSDLDRARAEESRARAEVEGAEKTKGAEVRNRESFHELVTAQEETTAAAQKATKIRQGLEAGDLKAAEATYKRLKELEKTKEDKLNQDIQFDPKISPELKQQQLEFAAAKKILKAKSDFEKEKSAADAGLFKDLIFDPETGEALGAEFQKRLGFYETQVKALDQLIKAGDATPEELKKQGIAVKEGLRELTEVPATQANLRKSGEKIAEFKKFGDLIKDNAQAASNAATTAALSVESAENQRTQKVYALRQAMAQVSAEKTVEARKQELEAIKQINAEAESIDKAYLDRGLISLQTYHDRRLDRIKSEGAKEAALLRTQLDNLLTQQAQGLGGRTAPERANFQQRINNTRDELIRLVGQVAYEQSELDKLYAKREDTTSKSTRKSLDTQIAIAEAHLKTLTKRQIETAQAETTLEGLLVQRKKSVSEDEQQRLDVQIHESELQLAELKSQSVIPGEIPTKEHSEQLDNTQKTIDLRKQLQHLQEQNAATLGGETAAIQQINTQYKEQLDTYKGLAGAADAIKVARESAIFHTQLEFQNRRLEDQLAIRRSVLELERAQTEAAADRGEITPTDVINRNNESLRQEAKIIVDRIALLTSQRRASEARLVQLEADLAIAQAAAYDAGTAIPDHSDALDAERIGVNRLTTSIQQLETELVNTGTRIETYGKQLRRVFTDSLASAISDSLTNLKDAGNRFIEFGNALRKQVADTIAKEFSTRITRALVNASSEKNYVYNNEKGELEQKGVKPGTSFFDRFFSVFGMKTGTPDLDSGPKGTEADPQYANVTVIDDKTKRPETFASPSIFNQSNKSDERNWDTYGDTWWYDDQGQPTSGHLKDLQTEVTKVARSSISHSEVTKIWDKAQKGFELLERFRTIMSGSGGITNLGAVNPLMLPGFSAIPHADGGLISGEGTGTSDSILARVSHGEHIMPASKTQVWLPVLEAIRTGQIPSPKFADGGLVELAQLIARRATGIVPASIVNVDAKSPKSTTGGADPDQLLKIYLGGTELGTGVARGGQTFETKITDHPGISKEWNALVKQYPAVTKLVSRVDAMPGKTVPEGTLFGTYTHDDQTIRISTDAKGIPLTSTQIRSTLVHELTHAAQFQNFPTTTEANHAYFEGEYRQRQGEETARAVALEQKYADLYKTFQGVPSASRTKGWETFQKNVPALQGLLKSFKPLFSSGGGGSKGSGGVNFATMATGFAEGGPVGDPEYALRRHQMWQSSNSGGWLSKLMGLQQLLLPLKKIFGEKGITDLGAVNPAMLPGFSAVPHAEGGSISGEGTGTSDSILARVSNGEYLLPADKTKQWLPLLESIRAGKLDGMAQQFKMEFGGLINAVRPLHALPTFEMGGRVGPVQSVAIPSIIPKVYASGGMVVTDGGASTVHPGGIQNLTVQAHPSLMNMTLREWLEQEVVRQHGRR